MAVRLDATTERLYRTANLPSATSYTICGWAQQVSTSGYQAIAGLSNTVSNPTGGAMELAVDAGTLEITWYGTGAGNGSANLPATTETNPFFWAMTCAGTGANSFIGYVRSAGANTLGSVSAVGSTFTPGVWGVGDNGWGEAFNGRIWNVKSWDRVLTPAELLVESFYEDIKYPTSKNFHWRLPSSSRTEDSSGNGRNPTVTGTLSTEPAGWQPWKPGGKIIVAVGGGGGGTEYTITPSGSIALSGAAVLLRTRAIAPAGAVALSGTAALARTRVQSASGSYALSGAAALLRTRVQVASGAITFASTAPITFEPGGAGPTEYTITPAGSIVYNGSSAVIRNRLQPAGGILAFSGTAVQLSEHPLSAGGVLMFAGGSQQVRTRVMSAGGSIVFDGTNTLVYTPVGGPVVTTSKLRLRGVGT